MAAKRSFQYLVLYLGVSQSPRPPYLGLQDASVDSRERGQDARPKVLSSYVLVGMPFKSHTFNVADHQEGSPYHPKLPFCLQIIQSCLPGNQYRKLALSEFDLHCCACTGTYKVDILLRFASK